MTRICKSRRQTLGFLAKGAVWLAPATLLGGCAVSTGGNSDATAALPAGGSHDAVSKGDLPQIAESGEPVKVALILPISGSIQLSVIGKALQQAAELALFERNAPQLQLVVRDDKGTAQGAASAAMTAIADGAEIILGPLLATSVAAAAPIARQAKVPMIAFSNDPANGGQGVHLLSFFASAEATRAVGFAVAQGKRHFAALIPDDVLGRDTEPAFRRAVEQGGGQVAIVERYPPSNLSGMIEPSQSVADAIRGSADSDHPIDALFLPSSEDNASRLAATVRHHDIDTSKVKLILSSGWDNPGTLREPKLTGAWLAGPDARGWNELAARFVKAYNSTPPRVASLAYDAVTVAAAFATQPAGRRFTPENLTRPGGFSGIDGSFKLTSNGPIERSLAVLEIQQQGLVVVDSGAPFGAVPTGGLANSGPTRGQL